MAQCLINKGDFNNYGYIFKPIFKKLECGILYEDIKILGKLETKRELYLLDSKYEPINIDISSYLNEKDYEIEWETNKIYEVEKIITKILKELNINAIIGSCSKSSRFFYKYLENIKINK